MDSYVGIILNQQLLTMVSLVSFIPFLLLYYFEANPRKILSAEYLNDSKSNFKVVTVQFSYLKVNNN